MLSYGSWFLGLAMEIKDYVAERKIALKDEILRLKKPPVLSIITIGENAASESYVRGKMKDAGEVGVIALLASLSEATSEEALLSLIQKQNRDEGIDGILVQLPLPKAISEKAVHLAIEPKKDVDGFSPLSPFECCTPKGIIDYLTAEGFPFKGANAVVLGRSEIVGKPMAKLLLKHDCNVTVLHSKTSEIDKRFYLSHADLVVVAIGKPGLIDETYQFKSTAWVVDVGINRGEDGHLHGDCLPGLRVAKQTPVPGGVGLLTRLALLENLLGAVKP
jgi:methylenetetrahydrofolate dehydrogenase (NADP+)/methenyltetrahydrofolate cyclohydrolase